MTMAPTRAPIAASTVSRIAACGTIRTATSMPGRQIGDRLDAGAAADLVARAADEVDRRRHSRTARGWRARRRRSRSALAGPRRWRSSAARAAAPEDRRRRAPRGPPVLTLLPPSLARQAVSGVRIYSQSRSSLSRGRETASRPAGSSPRRGSRRPASSAISTTRRATSSAFIEPGRGRSVTPGTRLLSVLPGWNAETAMPCCRPSSASEWVRPARPNLLAA